MPPPTSIESTPITLVALEQIHHGPADQQRLERDSVRIQELATSIQQHGIIVPLILRSIATGYETIAGGYRREAARVAGLFQVPAQIIECDDHTAWSISTTENLQRHNLTALEEAEIVRISHAEKGMTLEQIANTHGRSVGWVQDRLDLLTWDPILLHAIHTEQISKSAAAPLAGLDNTTLRRRLLEEAIRYGATARVTANWVRTAKLQSQHPNDTDVTRITEAPVPPAARVVATCWICRNDLDIVHMSHLPTCPNCIEAVRQRLDASTPTLQADNPITARSHSSTVTPT